MVILEIVPVLSGRNHGIFDSAFVHCVSVWVPVLCDRFCVYDLYLCQGIDLRGSGSRVAIHDVHYFPDRRRAAVMSWDHGTVYEQDVHGSEGPAQIPY